MSCSRRRPEHRSASLDSNAVSRYTNAPHPDVVGFLLNIIPNTVTDAFAKGEILQVLLLTSKGAAVTGGRFITLTATLATMNRKVPVAGMVLVLGIDRFMSEARAITNLFGNTLATMFVAWWDGALDVPKARAVLDRSAALQEQVMAR